MRFFDYAFDEVKSTFERTTPPDSFGVTPPKLGGGINEFLSFDLIAGSTPPGPYEATPLGLWGGVRDDLTPDPLRSNRGQASSISQERRRATQLLVIPPQAWRGEFVAFGCSSVSLVRVCLDPRPGSSPGQALRGEDAASRCRVIGGDLR